MKYICIVAAVTGFFVAGAAQAADLNTDYPIVEEPGVVVDPTVDWTGFYAGATAGYGWASAKSIYGAVDPKGGFVGADVGYNQQFGQFVLGGEADIHVTGMSGSVFNAGVPTTISGSVDYFGTVRGRAGLAIDRFMPYVTAGLSYGGSHGHTTTGPGYDTQDRLLGWTAGAGVEYAVTEKISLKAEYLYHDYGNVTYFAGTPVAETIHTSLSTARVGINFKF